MECWSNVKTKSSSSVSTLHRSKYSITSILLFCAELVNGLDQGNYVLNRRLG
jgi:hypothetical protein